MALVAGAAVTATSLGDRSSSAAPIGAGFVLDAGDLAFILDQIRIAENHAGGAELLGSGANQVPEPRLPFGLRTVDGSLNHLLPGQERFGAADELFPRLTGKQFPAVPGYSTAGATVSDTQPRIISNLIVDQTTDNPVVAELRPDCLPGETCFIPNVAPDVGLSAPFNTLFTFFGQFFDHGLDLVTKGGGNVFVPLETDDPLFVPGGPNFMVISRATVDANHEATNTTTPFVDQNQTYTSHPSHQVFLRDYDTTSGSPVPNGRLLDGAIPGSIANWAEVKAQAASVLGILLDDVDVSNVPLIATDPYGHFIPGDGGFPQVVFPGGVLTEGNPGAPISVVGSEKTGHAFLDDIAHNAVPDGSYDPALLGRHFVTGDGRGNENIALTAVHTVFHSEHNRLAAEIDGLITAMNPSQAYDDWHAPAGPAGWTYGERLFQAARFVTEMQYQHLVFEEFARKLVPQINPFIVDGINFQSDTNPAISAEFAHAVYRLGHSMLTETVHRKDPITGFEDDIDLLDAFLNPDAFTTSGGGGTAANMAGAILQGSALQSANEIDEFVTEALRNNLLGLPLDLATINLARGRSEGVAPLNVVRAELFDATGRPELAPYASWADFSFSMRHPESLVNFVAAYGRHSAVLTATTLAGRRAAADSLVNGVDLPGPDGAVVDDPGTAGDETADNLPAPGDREDFLFSTGTWTGIETGLNQVDLWMGGLAERQSPFGGLLGSTFSYVFEIQLENLQNADRFYYLERLDGLNMLVQLEGNSLGELIERNTTTQGLPADVFSRADLVFNLANLGTGGAILNDPTTDIDESLMPDLVRLPDGTIRYTGPLHVVWNGRDTADIDRVRSSEGDDTLRGNGGVDVMEGGDGNDQFIGGEGDDVLTDIFGDDVIKGAGGNDAISSGPGLDLNQGGLGNDFIVAGSDGTETFGGQGNDIIYAGEAEDTVFGDQGDDWIEGGAQLDLLQGDQGNQFQDDPNGGHDVISGGLGDDDYDSEGGDDVMIVDSLGTERAEGMLGFDWVTYRGDPLPVDADMDITGLLPPNIDELRDRFDLTEALSGYNRNDILRGDSRDAAALVGHELNEAGIARVAGTAALLPPGATSFNAGNIILGGEGSDLIEGKGGDDVIDGDRWLNVQLQAGATFANSLTQLRTAVFNRTINPGSISIVRSIVTPTAPAADCGPGTPLNCDTALFSGARAEYTITFNGNGSVTVTHDGAGIDGVDTLWNMERAQFTDQTVALAGAGSGNNPAAGTVNLSDATPSEDQLLTATPAITDLDGVPATITLTWQASNGGPFAPVGTGATFTPGDAHVGQTLRVVATFTDNAGNPESVTSAVTAAVANVNDVPAGAPTLNAGAALPQEGELITASAAGITDGDGLTGAVMTFQWQQRGGGNFANIAGATGTTFTPTQAEVGRRVRVAVSFTDDHGTTETLFSAETGVVGDVFVGTAAANTFNGTAGRDLASGGGGADALNMAGSDDIASGDAGNDAINANGGDDTIRFNGAGEGFDSVAGGAGTDTIVAMSANTVIGLTDLNGVEAISSGGFAGVSILGSAAANTLNFAGLALTGIVSIDGGGGNDTITGSTLADVLFGGAGLDTINGGAGNDTITGGAGNDTMNGQGGFNTFVFATGFGNDTINGFDAAPGGGGQDRLNIAALGVTAAAFALNVSIASANGGANTLVTIGGASIRLIGVNSGAVTAADFILAP